MSGSGGGALQKADAELTVAEPQQAAAAELKAGQSVQLTPADDGGVACTSGLLRFAALNPHQPTLRLCSYCADPLAPFCSCVSNKHTMCFRSIWARAGHPPTGAVPAAGARRGFGNHPLDQVGHISTSSKTAAVPVLTALLVASTMPAP